MGSKIKADYTRLGATIPSTETLNSREAKMFTAIKKWLNIQNDVDLCFNAMEVDDVSIVIEWWKLHRSEFPVITECAWDYLTIPCSAVHVERLFSRARDLQGIRRTTMSPRRI